MSQTKHNLSLAIIGATMFLCLNSQTSQSTYASTYSASITAPSSIELNVSPSGDGAAVTNSDLVVNSTCPLGYTVSISGPSDSTLYEDGDGTSSSQISPTSGTKTTPAQIVGDSNLNTWGYSITSASATGTFIGLNGTTTELLSTNAASASGGDTIPVYYGASASPALTMGAYTFANDSGSNTTSSKITYYLTTSPDCMSYTVQFNPTSTAGGTTLTGTGTMDDQRIPEDVVTILNRNAYTPPTGYYFTGWNTAQDGTGTTYLDRQQVLNITSVGTTIPLTLYAQYKAITNCNPNGTTIPADITNPQNGEIVCMQDITSANKASVLASMTEDSQYQLIDKRDQKVYWVSKLKDGNIWMTQNLDLDLFTDRPLTSEDTDLTDHSLAGAYQAGYTYDSNTGVTTWTPANDTISAITDESTSGSIGGWVNSPNNPYSVDTGNWYWSGTYYDSSYCLSNSSNSFLGCNYVVKTPDVYSDYFSTTPYSGSGTSNNSMHGHVGNYYNWSNAIASNNSSNITTSTYNNPSNNPQNSVCPAGWRLPVITVFTSGSLGANEFYNLNYYYNSGVLNTDVGLIGFPLYFVRAGDVWSNRVAAGGHNGTYWSSTSDDGTKSYYIWFLSYGSNRFSYNHVRYLAGSVRCLVR